MAHNLQSMAADVRRDNNNNVEGRKEKKRKINK
jgi:hypothetical protein